MQSLNGKLIFSATDLSNFLACPHLTLLSQRTALGGPKPRQFPDPGLEVLRQRGLEHEHLFLAGLRDSGARRIADLTAIAAEPSRDKRFELHAKATADAMKDGVDVVYQGFLFDGSWLGYPDFLRKVDRPGKLGAWSYEVVDTKLAREAKGGALLQILLYADLLEGVQGIAPEFVHLALGGPAAPLVSFRVKHYAAYYRLIRKRFLEWVAAAPAQLPLAVDPVTHCDICDWDYSCTKERRDVDHLSFVAGISRQQRRALVANGVATLEALGELDITKTNRFAEISPSALPRIHYQARIQLEGRRQGNARHELLEPVVPDQGLAALPEPSPGDLFLDLEGDPYALDLGIEYLFGVVDASGEYDGRWSLDRATERKTFEWFVDMAGEALQRFPKLHIYHYAAYEPTALKRLAGRYDSRIDELDRLLRGKVFVDLYRVVRQGLRASVESYSIKKMEAFYQFERQVDLRQANSALADFEAWLQLGGSRDGGSVLLEQIEGYNKDDCLSTLKLREWLETLRGPEVPRPSASSAQPAEELAEKLKEAHALMDRLTPGVPEEAQVRTPEQQGRWLLAQMLEYHRRENKSMWWRYFNRREMSNEELIEDGAALGGLEYVGEVGKVKRSLVHRYRFPVQEHQLGPGAPCHDPKTGQPAGEIVAFDEAASTIDLKRGKTSAVPHPHALIPYEYVGDEVLHSSLMRLGSAVAEHGLTGVDQFRSAVDLVLAAAPRVGQNPGDDLAQPGEAPLDAAIRLVAALDRSVLPIQGPPGSGKTYTGARMILSELARGRKVGVTGTSHKVISNLLTEVSKAAKAMGTTLKGIQKAEEDQWCGVGAIVATDKNEAVLDALQSGEAHLAAGTAWLWSREDMAGTLDVLFIDEAGQFALANALAVAPAATNLVLLGDPRQLQQPQQGLHPPGTDVSALDHLLAGKATMPDDRGLFLDQTWRLHPEICAFTSEIYYDDRLTSRPGLERQRVEGTEPATGSGLRWVPVAHSGNQNESPEEAATIASLVGRLLDARPMWTTEDGQQKTLLLNDILVVAPYNAHVAAIEKVLPPGAQVGTVDKFQGQEAPIVIYSMASSSAEDAPRGMEFLYSPNRLNVATSRARCLVILVANGRLFFPECRTPEQMRLANGLCRYLELASTAS
jgi:predicted RecB family nuclease